MSDRIDREMKLHASPVLRVVFIALGWVFVALGVAGIFLPLVPTTPFLLVAAACFARGSERFYRWLLSSRFCGPVIREWRATRSIPRSAKRTAQVLLVVTFGSTVLFFAPTLLVRVVVGAFGVVAFIVVSRLPVRDPAPDLAESAAGAE